MQPRKYAVIERRGNHYVILCNFIAGNAEHFGEEIVFAGTLTECHSYAGAHSIALKTRACWENMLRKGSATPQDMATIHCQ